MSKGKRDPVEAFDNEVLACLREIDDDDFEPGNWSVLALSEKLPATQTDAKASLARLFAKGLVYNNAMGWRIKPRDPDET